MVCCLLFQALLYQNGNVRPVQIFSPVIEEKMHITKSQSLFFAVKAILNINTDLLLRGQTNGT